MFKIRKNVPIPSRNRGPGRAPLYPFGEMGVGDSFVVPIPAGDTTEKVVERVRAAASTWCKRNLSTLRFAVRPTVESDTEVVGVWAEMALPKLPKATKLAAAPSPAPAA